MPFLTVPEIPELPVGLDDRSFRESVEQVGVDAAAAVDLMKKR